ncbi:MAG: OmpH family outer membrane protein [Novosphingobium sp.]
MKTTFRIIAIAGLMLGASQAALAAKQETPAASAGPNVPGLAVVDMEAVVANSNAFKVAQQQRPVTYKATIDAAEARKNQITAQLQPLIDKFNRDRQAATANTPAGQNSLQQQAESIQRIQQSGQQELQTMLRPVALSEAYVTEQISDKLSAAVQAAMTKNKISLVINPQAVVAAAGSYYSLNQAIIDELNTAIPSAQLVPPNGWEPREIREARAAQAAQQGGASAAGGQPAPRPSTPAGPSPDGR